MIGLVALDGLRRRGFLGLRVVADVHGDAAAFAHAVGGAAAARLFILQLGDLTDYGPDGPEALRLMFGLLDAGHGRFLLGNHDHKLRRVLVGQKVRVAEGLALTLAQLAAAPDGEALARRAVVEIGRAPAWLVLGGIGGSVGRQGSGGGPGDPGSQPRAGRWGFVHAGWHPAMEQVPSPPDAGTLRPEDLLARAMFGQVTGGLRADGFPERLHRWVDRIPAGLTVYCGHDRRSVDGRPLVQQAAAGGSAVFLDTGAGKGGHLCWIDLPFEALGSCG